MRTIFHEQRKTGRLDLEAVEMALRSALHRAGAGALSQLLQWSPPAAGERTLPCPCGQQADYKELRAKTILTVVGLATVKRPYYLCDHCGEGQFPVDQELDVAEVEVSPGVRRMMAVVSSESAFEQGRQHLELLADLKVTTKAVERHAEQIGADIEAREQAEIQRSQQLQLPLPIGPPIPMLYIQMDATGVPVVGKERVGRVGKTDGQPARSRDVKLGCVFTQTYVDEEGRPMRDEASTSYTGAIETAEVFGRRLYLEASRRGWHRAVHKVVMGDGAVWIWNLAQEYFPGAICIVDLYHARKHLHDLSKLLFPDDAAARQSWLIQQQDLLDDGQIESLVTALRLLIPEHPKLEDQLGTEADYFQTNAERMRYPKFRSQGLFVCSGVIEAGCKTAIGSRLKKSGMFWTVNGANKIIALRCTLLSGRFEDYWETRARAA